MHNKQRNPMQPNYHNSKLNFLHKVTIFFSTHRTNPYNSFSPCSGLVVSGYSKSHEHDEPYIANALKPYKEFKKMYFVDTTNEFKGK